MRDKNQEFCSSYKESISDKDGLDLSFREQLAAEIFRDSIDLSAYSTGDSLKNMAEKSVQAADCLIEALE